MGVVWNGEGNLNSTSDPKNHYNGNISIEIRGSSSQMFPKKSFGFETKDDTLADLDVPLLGLPAEEDWILYAPYTDKSLMRNVLTFTLAQSMGHYASRCRYVELFLNKNYHGIYVLMEKIKRDSTRVDIAKLKPDDIIGTQLTGGYIVKIDKMTGTLGSGWYSAYANNATSKSYYQVEYPDYDEINDIQKNYIKTYFDAFETEVYNGNFDPESGYLQYIDKLSFIDNFIVNEMSKNVDGYRLSSFFHKDKKGKINAGPIWDYNLAWGNANYYDAWKTIGLEVDVNLGQDNWANPFFWSRFLMDQNFTNDLKCRYTDLRKSAFSTERMLAVTDSLYQLLKEPADRNFGRWPVLGKWIWPNQYVGQDFVSEVNWLKKWILERANWLDGAVPGECGGVVVEPVKGFDLTVNPNPVRDKLFVEIASEFNLTCTFELFGLNGQRLFTRPVSVAPGYTRFDVNANSIPNGVFIYRLLKGDTPFKQGKLVKF